MGGRIKTQSSHRVNLSEYALRYGKLVDESKLAGSNLHTAKEGSET